jgi:hypothetical protein
MDHTTTSFNLKLQGSSEDIQAIHEVFQNVYLNLTKTHTFIYPYEKLISQDPSFPDDVIYRNWRVSGGPGVLPVGLFAQMSNTATTLSLEFISQWYPTVRFVKFLCQEYKLSASLSFFESENYFDGRFVFDCHGHLTNIKLDESLDRMVFMEISNADAH